MIASKTLAAIDAAIEDDQEREHRNHLGASLLGGKCMRKIWYSWRWAAKEYFPAQKLRLFERGQLEEARFLGYLQRIGCDVWPVNPETGAQWRITFAMGHGGGSADGVARGIPDLPPGTPFLTEFKTHNEDSFKSLVKEGLCQSKPEHFAQTQIYMVKMGLPAALYIGVNKNTDHLHPEVIMPNPTFVDSLMARADDIVASEVAPRRVSNDAGFYYCKSYKCLFYDICFKNKAPEQNCRTCVFSQPAPDGVWRCTRYACDLTRDQQRKGCDDYQLKPGISDSV